MRLRNTSAEGTLLFKAETRFQFLALETPEISERRSMVILKRPSPRRSTPEPRNQLQGTVEALLRWQRDLTLRGDQRGLRTRTRWLPSYTLGSSSPRSGSERSVRLSCHSSISARHTSGSRLMIKIVVAEEPTDLSEFVAAWKAAELDPSATTEARETLKFQSDAAVHEYFRQPRDPAELRAYDEWKQAGN